VADLAKQAHRFKNKNARLAVVGSGAPHHFKEFRAITGYQDPLFTDPSRKAFNLLGFSNSITGFMSANSLFKAMSALKNGHRQGSVQGSTLQLGGAVIIDAAGLLLYYFAGRKAGEHPDIDELIQAIDN
jgi:AhpC/TSA antioxidant enzyme